ncbi:MAG: hypothetical protein COX77_02085 [Candidatus Komeilibacteria bacterium CG_4_10_14_0_2_um_filter_37_10]|uniref:Uncharacterized protein n=1 Tax=Candidatus Komeilibacteria bacterium CG_4_10_14_0_2_um_filter_37_10 TaxID=1974470 RepID=A0A2M7VFI8_9BACT|nr:MAG: hypothetical protein COX77_02085 [Candidatus Komeilibacteria bacterium CG_4_10_14_0_2_um_filter_37_10]
MLDKAIAWVLANIIRVILAVKLNIMNNQEKSHGSVLIIALVLIIGLLLVGNGLTMYYLYQKNDQPINDEKELVNQAVNERLNEGELIVEWLKNDTTVNVNDFIKSEKASTKLLQEIEKIKADGDSQYSFDTYQKGFNIRLVGKVIQGKYKDYNLYVMVVRTVVGMPGPATLYRFVSNQKQNIILSKNFHELSNNVTDFFSIDDEVVLTNLSMPAEIEIASAKVRLQKNETTDFPTTFFYELSSITPLFKYDGQNYLYQKKDQSDNALCFVVRTPDGLVQDYIYNINNDQQVNTQQLSLQLNLVNGSSFTGQYSISQRSSCGSYCLERADYLEQNKLQLLGTNIAGEKFYIFSDQQQKTNTTDKDSILQTIYDRYYPGFDEKLKKEKEKITFDEFLKTNPIIIWPDPLGNYLVLKNIVYSPAVECGKPVIYLYPEKEMSVAVQVQPTGGFTTTEPAYNDGWQVLAKPNSELYNYADSTWYPYLFWEGYGLNYQQPEKGFVIAREKMEQFLRETLPQLGLIPKEYDEFIAYWLPRLQKDNYYFITFVDQNDFNKMAPLAVQPQPNTIIRVFMDFQGLDNYRQVEPLVITTPVRQGFTVVEWGGAIHH